MSYPNNQTIATLAEVKSYSNITSASYDTFINAYLPVIDRAIENYCRRRFLSSNWIQWVTRDKELITDNYPINNILLIGIPKDVVLITDTNNIYNFNITQTSSNNISIDGAFKATNTSTLVTTEFLFSTYTTLGALKNAVEMALVGVTFAYQANSTPLTYANLNTLSLRAGSGKTIYAGINYFDQTTSTSLGDVYRISDNSDRLVINPNLAEVSHLGNFGLGMYSAGYSNIDSGYTLNYYNEYDIMVIYDAGYTTANMPQELKWIAASVIRDLMSLYDIDSSGGYKGIMKQENLGDYGYSLDPNANVSQLLNRYADQLDYFKKKCI